MTELSLQGIERASEAAAYKLLANVLVSLCALSGMAKYNKMHLSFDQIHAQLAQVKRMSRSWLQVLRTNGDSGNNLMTRRLSSPSSFFTDLVATFSFSSYDRLVAGCQTLSLR